MSRRSNTDTRRIYSEKGCTKVCFDGQRFGTRNVSIISTEVEAKVEKLHGGKVQVTQGARSEIWNMLRTA